MSSTRDTTVSLSDSLIAAAREMAPLVAASAEEAEQARRLPQPLVDAMVEAGLFRMVMPASLGGAEADPLTIMRVIEEVAQADGAAGWSLMIGSTSAIVVAYLPEQDARALFGNPPRGIFGGVVAPTGKATVVEGGYRVSGRWSYGSGIEHCEWHVGGCLLFEDRTMRLSPKGVPQMRLMLFPGRESIIHDTWNVSGLRGTGSHDYSVQDIFVPEAHALSLIEGPLYQTGPLYRLPIFGLLAMSVASVATGIARGAINALMDLAGAKMPMGSRKVLAEQGMVQVQVAQAEALLRSGRAFLIDAASELWEAVSAGNAVSVEQRMLLRLAAAHATSSAAQAVDLMYQAGGATANFSSSPLQRAFRDVHAATQHAMVAPLWYETAGRHLLKLPVDTMRL
ncbi:MAG: acyl-CoA dehydrogenase family protein [Ardenticatenales bacterium]|nr:acyl-CoA dehydrogenase family protein [Ardenticatenales bacterium]